MSGAKEIRSKIASIQKTQKITRAMEMISASKMQKAQQRMKTSRPYAQKIRNVIMHLATSHSEYHHMYMEQRDIKNVGVIVISSDRGLCGGLNANLFRKSIKRMQAWKEQDVGISVATLGKKAEAFFKRYGGTVIASKTQLGDKPPITDLIGVVKSMLDAYANGDIDVLYIVSNEFVNTMTQKPEFTQLLPLPRSDSDDARAHYWDYIYEPDAKALLEKLLTRYVESQAYQSVVENIACEQAARMIAMKSATDNAGELINKFQLQYNKARQAAITQEISEIVGGAEAI